MLASLLFWCAKARTPSKLADQESPADEDLPFDDDKLYCNACSRTHVETSNNVDGHYHESSLLYATINWKLTFPNSKGYS